MQPKKIYSMQQAIPADYEGCFCDRHFQVIKKLEEIPFESANGEHQNKPNSSSTIKEKGASCSCLGKSIIDIPNNFSLNVRKMYVFNTLTSTQTRQTVLFDFILSNCVPVCMFLLHGLHWVSSHCRVWGLFGLRVLYFYCSICHNRTISNPFFLLVGYRVCV